MGEEDFDVAEADYELDPSDPCYFNLSEYLRGGAVEPRSWRCFYWSELLPALAVYTITMVLGIAGNLLIVFTTCRYRRMKSPTNVFLASLAAADLLLVLVCIPVKVAKLFSYTWTMGFFLCKTVHYVQTVVAICSVLTLTAISVERYYAIVHPMKAKYVCTISQAKKIILTTWSVSILLALPNLYIQVHVEFGDIQKGFYCTVDYENRPMLQVYVLYMLLLILVLPTSVMLIAYATICWEICRVMRQRHHMVSGQAVLKPEIIPLASKPQNGRGIVSNKRPCTDDKSGNVKQVIKMLVLIVVIFILCWAPILIMDLLTAYEVLPEYATDTLKHVRTAFHLMAYFNSCVNPLVYGFMSKNFRESFGKAAGRCCRRPISRQLSVSQSRGTSVRLRDRSTFVTQT